MRIKIRKGLLSFVVRCVVCIAVFAVLSGVKNFLPGVYGFIEKTLTKSTDLKKIGSLLLSAIKEIT